MDGFNFAPNHRAHACFMTCNPHGIDYWVCTRQQITREEAVEWWSSNSIRPGSAHKTMTYWQGWHAWQFDKNVLWTYYWKK